MARKAKSDDFYFEGFAHPTTTPVPDVVFDRFLARLGEAELKALLYIIRRTFGFKKDRDPISFNQFLRGITTRSGEILDEGCGIKDRTSLSKALKSLEDKGIVTSEKGMDEKGENVTTVYSLRFRDNSYGVVGNSYHPGRDNPPPVVGNPYPQQTVLQQTVKQEYDDDTASLLQNFGVSKLQAQRLASNYPPELIMEKLDLAQYLESIHSPLVAKNPAGWLVRAIEQNYLPDKIKGYRSKAQREQEEQERRLQDEVIERVQEARRQAIEAFREKQVAKPIAGTSLTTKTAWEKALAILEKDLNRANYLTWIKPLALIDAGHDQMLIGAPSPFVLHSVQTRMRSRVANALSNVIGRRVEVDFEVVPEMTKGDIDE